MISRQMNAQVDLVRWASSQIGNAFVWGETNCLALALTAIDVQCGSALMDKFRRQMSSELRAQAWVKKHGFAGLVESFLSEGLVEIEPAFIQPGDLALVTLPDTLGASIFLGQQYLSSTAAGGVAIFGKHALRDPEIIVGVR
jgi:hypothetical protein